MPMSNCPPATASFSEPGLGSALTPGQRLAQLTELFRPQIRRSEPDALFKQLTRSALSPTILEAWSRLMNRVAELHDQVDAAQEELEALHLGTHEGTVNLDVLIQVQWSTLQARFPQVHLEAEPLGHLHVAPPMAAAVWCQMLEFVAGSAALGRPRRLLVQRRDTPKGSVFDLRLSEPNSAGLRHPADPGRPPGLDHLLIRAAAAASGGDARISDCPLGARILYAVTTPDESMRKRCKRQEQPA